MPIRPTCLLELSRRERWISSYREILLAAGKAAYRRFRM